MMGGMRSDRVNLQHRPFLTPIWLTAAAFGLAFLFVVFMLWVLVTADATTVIVVVKPDDSAMGQARAAVLSKMFGTQGPGRLDAIYLAAAEQSSPVFAPLSGFPTAIAKESPGKLARRALREHGGGRVLIVGDSDTQKRVIEALAGGRLGNAPVDDPAAMYVITVPRIGHANLLRLDY
jgi:hypothetical protein